MTSYLARRLKNYDEAPFLMSMALEWALAVWAQPFRLAISDLLLLPQPLLLTDHSWLPFPLRSRIPAGVVIRRATLAGPRGVVRTAAVLTYAGLTNLTPRVRYARGPLSRHQLEPVLFGPEKGVRPYCVS